MKLTKEALNVLKNFSIINQNLYLYPGKEIRTQAPNKTIFAIAQVDETFPVEFGIYDLSKFLGVISLFSDPDLNFGESSVVISAGRNKVRYAYAAAENLIIPPNRPVNFETNGTEFVMTADQLNKIQKAAGVLSVPDISIKAAGGTLSVVVHDLQNPSSDDYSLEVGEIEGKFRYDFKVDNLKLIESDYNVAISTKKIAQFETVAGDIKYWIASQATSES